MASPFFISIESISKMLGHNNIKIAQVYAKVTDLKISQDHPISFGCIFGMLLIVCGVVFIKILIRVYSKYL